MKVTLLPSSVEHGAGEQRQFLTTYLLNDTVAIDAGSLGFFHTPQGQARVKHVLLTHTHSDHVASLAVFVENVYEGKKDCVTIHGSDAVLDSLQHDIFNNRVWPDFIALSTPEAPFLKIARLDAGKAVDLEGLRITPVPINHVVPTFGYLIQDRTSAVVIATDTGPTDDIWKLANATANLKAVFLETTFPNSMQWLADISKHLTPATFALEVKKLTKQVPILVMHLKARFHVQVVNELQAMGIPHLEIVQYGKAYSF